MMFVDHCHLALLVFVLWVVVCGVQIIYLEYNTLLEFSVVNQFYLGLIW